MVLVDTINTAGVILCKLVLTTEVVTNIQVKTTFKMKLFLTSDYIFYFTKLNFVAMKIVKMVNLMDWCSLQGNIIFVY